MTSHEEQTTTNIQQSSSPHVMPPSPDRAAASSPAPINTATTLSEPESKSVPRPNPRLQAIAAKRANLEATLADLRAQRSALVADAKLPSGLEMPTDWSEEQKTKQALATANGVIKEHIALLHKYNEIKDIGQGLMGLIADKRGVRVADVMEDFGVGEKD